MIMSIDIETYSGVDLVKAGVYAYAESPDFEVLLFGWAFDDAPVQVWDCTIAPIPEELVEAITSQQVIKTAFNANFERVCLAEWLGEEMKPEQWRCTAVLARELGLPSSLEDVGKALGLPDDKQKLKIGRALIRYFSKPMLRNGQILRRMPSDDPDKWALYLAYNKQDVESEREIRRRLESFTVDKKEQQLWCLDQRINDRGVLVDLDFAKAAALEGQKAQDKAAAELVDLTSIKNPKSTVQFKAWLQSETGQTIATLERKHLPDVIKTMKSETAIKAIDIRSEIMKTSTAKYDAMIRAACADHRIRGLTQFYGAGRTGRWAGRLVQMQNLPQNKIGWLDAARNAVLAGDLELITDKPAAVLSQLIRTAFVPKPGCKFIVSDFSSIEARVIAWLADEDWRMEVFRTHGKIYEASAEQMFHLPPGSVKKGDPMRQKGKIAELALGYGGSVGAMAAMGALQMGLTEEELKPIVDAWRRSNPKIVKLWWDVDNMVTSCLLGSQLGPKQLKHGLSARMDQGVLRIRLPSGRELSYQRPRLITGGGKFGGDVITYDGISQTTGQWARTETYGPKIVENIVQATARDCLAEAMISLEEVKLPIVFHVHDEVICEVPVSTSVDAVSDIMSRPLEWASGLPLKADAYECMYYRKD